MDETEKSMMIDDGNETFAKTKEEGNNSECKSGITIDLVSEEKKHESSQSMLDSSQNSKPTIRRRQSNVTLLDTSSKRAVSQSKKESSFAKRFWKKSRKMYATIFLKHRLVKFLQISLVFYICIYMFCFEAKPESVDTETGFIVTNGTERPLVATTAFQKTCLVVARITAWYMYPPLVVVFVSKFRATTSFFAHTPLSMYLPTDTHQLHVYCGSAIFYASLIHTICHFIRYAAQSHLELIVNNKSGLSGCFVVVALLLICIPMTFVRDRLKYEMRKILHYFFIVFLVAMCFHAPMSSLPYSGYCTIIFAALLVWYIIDASYCTCFMTEKIQSTKFHVLSNGLQVTMRVSDAFKNRTQGKYVYICLPWVAKNQWHAFSVFENPEDEQERQIFMSAVGDWTKKTHDILQRDTQRPAWIQGPFPSPFNNSDSYDNMIIVASGIGITPALSVIQTQYQFKRINLIWTVKDIELLVFFLNHATFDDDGWNLIFYTGKEPLDQHCLDIMASADVCIICGRPDLDQLVPNLIYCVESKKGLPEKYFAREDIEAIVHTTLRDSVLSAAKASTLFRRKSSLSHASIQSNENREMEQFAASFNNKSLSSNSSSFQRSSVFIDQEHMQNIDFDVPWDYIPGAEDFVDNLCTDIILPNWGMMYCGGARGIKKSLKDISNKIGVDLYVESFDW
eukprot:CAMPEP_0178914310 /NCGR_PEP_ID=MMETSP0786-20121207/11353_1 /TAXON_ID=186022 /ORGANISM="Thalassionema frauenfeldii, Strain CCMP 1798" /LENGTH=679 /DNA_ID=CAMNT_0020587201 /DNA_START=52 /DNA_END=2091 /DNA_ORIENTATION=+